MRAAGRAARRPRGLTAHKLPSWISNIDEAKGRTKRATGELAGDDDLKREGTIDKTAGKAKETVDKAADKAKDLLEKH